MAISRKRQTLVEFCSKQFKFCRILICWGLIDRKRRSYEQNLLFKIT